MTASVMSLTDEGRPIGDRLSITSFGVSRWSGVSTTPGATALTRMPSFAYSIARCWVIVLRPPLVIIGTEAVTPRIGLRARAAGAVRPRSVDRDDGQVERELPERDDSEFLRIRHLDGGSFPIAV